MRAKSSTVYGRGEGFFLLLPFLVLQVIFWMAPVLGALHTSVHSNTLGAETTFVGMENYARILENPRFWKAVANTTRLSLLTLLGVLPFALLLAQGVTQSPKRLRAVLTFSLLLPALAPPAVLALLFLLVFHGGEGILNRLLITPWGFTAVNWLKDPTAIPWALWLQSVWRWTGIVTFFLLAAMRAIPRSLYEAAHLETSSTWTVWRHITVPALRPVLIFSSLFLVVDSFAQFSGAYVLLGGSGGTADAGLLLVTLGYQTAFTFGQFGTAAAMGLLPAPFLIALLVLIALPAKGIRA